LGQGGTLNREAKDYKSNQPEHAHDLAQASQIGQDRSSEERYR
jgi:hypothetical protein